MMNTLLFQIFNDENNVSMNFLMHIPLGQVFFFFAAAAAKSLQSCLTLATP